MIYVNAREYKEKMSKFQIGDKVVCVRNTPAVQEGWVGYVKELDMLVRPLDYMAESEDGNGTFAFYEWELELLEHAKKEQQPLSIGDICTVSDELAQLVGQKEVCVHDVFINKGRFEFSKWPLEEDWEYKTSIASVKDIEMVLWNHFEEQPKKEEVKQEQYTGSSSDYYKVFVTNPTTLSEAYYAECNDIIEALEMDFAEGNAFKAIWRKAKARQGVKKKGYDNGVYDSEKVVFFGERMLVKAKNEAD